MTKLSAADSGRSVVVRWRMLAERRLKYLIELYESGRWKLYYNEPEFLKIVREAHAALKAWETLAPPEDARDRPVEVEAARRSRTAAGRSTASQRSAHASLRQCPLHPSRDHPWRCEALRSSTYGVGT